MAADAVDAAAARARRRACRPASPTASPLVGADGYQALLEPARPARRASPACTSRAIEHLLGRYGARIDELLELIAGRPELAEPLPGAEDYLRAEVVYAATHEGARHLDDVLARRTRISIETFDRGVAAARPAAELMAGVLGWDQARLDEEVDHYLRRVEAERQSQLALTDQEADEARVSAPDIV